MKINPFLARVATPAIAQAAGWALAYDASRGPLINLSQAVPGHAPPAAMLECLAAAAGSPEAARYGPILGDDAVRHAYASEVSARYGASIAAEETAITAGCNQAFFVAMMALAKAGDAVILPVPYYFNHKMTLDMLGIETRLLETRPETGFLPTLADIEALIDETVRAIAIVSPNNPTGAIYPPALIAGIHALCRRHGIAFVLDETYRDFLEDPAPPHDLFALPDWQDDLVCLYSFSKSYAVPGHRLGAMIAGRKGLDEMEKVLDSLQICSPRPPQAALAWAIAALAPWRAEMSAEIVSKAALFRGVMAGHSGWRIEQMGAYFAYVRHPFAGVPGDIVAETMATRLGIVTLPGSFFGPGQENHLRIAFANVAPERIEALGERLALADALFPEPVFP